MSNLSTAAGPDQMVYLLDHNAVIHVIERIGAFRTAKDITAHAPTNHPATENFRYVVTEVLAGRAVLVTTDRALGVLKYVLTRELNLLEDERAEEVVVLLRVLAKFSGGLVENDTASRHKPETQGLMAHIGAARGAVQDEDVDYVAALVAYLKSRPATGGDYDAVLYTFENGLKNSCVGLISRGILTVDGRKSLRGIAQLRHDKGEAARRSA